MGKITVFLDTDVVISALLSRTGASFEIIKNPKIEEIISKGVEEEVEEISKRLNISSQDTKNLLNKINIIHLKFTKRNILKEYKEYVFDEEDSHVVAGVAKSKSKFLLTHNTKHYKVDKINADLGIITLKPGNFLQYLKSKDKF